MAQQNIDFGAPNWNEKVNANLSDLYAGGGTPTLDGLIALP